MVQTAGEVPAPGVISHDYGGRFTLGEPDGTRSERVTALSQTLIAAGLKAPVRARIRDDLWVKLWGNMAFNPVSVLTGGRLHQMIPPPPPPHPPPPIMPQTQPVSPPP